MKPTIPRALVPSVAVPTESPRQVRSAFQRELDAGARIVAVGKARKSPGMLLRRGYVPRHRLELFDTVFYLAAPRQNEDMRFFVTYVGKRGVSGARQRFHARIFYKDVSMTWRSASHFVRSESENWVGKGDLKPFVEDGKTWWHTDEGTTDLPLEIQTALETLVRVKRLPYDDDALQLVLRRAPDNRADPYSDFIGPRRKAQSDPRNLVNGGKLIARFTRRNDPTSLRFVKGYEPDFGKGILERSQSFSQLYGGRLRRFRVASRNQQVQYFFLAGRRLVWINSCQATTTELSSFGVRTIDAEVAEDLLLPAYEYHFLDELVDPPEFHTQIPEGFAGKPSPRDPYRADTAPWLDKMPVIREFRRKVLKQRALR
jgi:hypothetical protein